MRKIFAIGETVYDVIFKNGQPQAAKPGGAMLNSCVSLGRIGLPVYFMSEYADDNIGSLINGFLSGNGVDTSNVYHYRDGNTKLAMAFLDEKNNASYVFYEKYPAKRLDIDLPAIGPGDLLLCGSIYAITGAIRGKFLDMIDKAVGNGAIVIYDPNFRSSHRHELEKLKPLIIENMKMAGIVRGSDEDFRNIFGTGTPDEAWDVVSNYCDCLVYTASEEGVFVRTNGFKGEFPVKKITPVSTIGAGDNFNAGMMVALYINQIQRSRIGTMGKDIWSGIISMGVDFATEVCMSYENYISVEFASGIKGFR